MHEPHSVPQQRRLTLLAALLWSLLLHLLLVGGSTLSLIDLFPPGNDVLAARQPLQVQRVRLASSPPPPAASPPATLELRLSPRRPPRGPAGGRRQAPAIAAFVPPKAITAPPTVTAPAEGAAGPGTGKTPSDTGAERAPADGNTASPLPEPEAIPVAAEPEEPAPTFPVQLSARLAARIGGLSLPLQQEWWMEGYRYAITVRGSRLGIPLQASSEGRVAAGGGLQPERSTTLVGGKVRGQTESAGGRLRLGRPGEMREVDLPLVVQDMMSLPFHLAVTFDGTPRTLFVSSGHSVQQYRFTLVAEEVLRLPAGRLRTLHLQGEYFDYRLREMIRIVEVWLAVDYLNIPVKVSGHLRDGQPFEYRMEALEIEGRPVLDSARPELSSISDDAIPERLRARHAQGLKNP